VYNTLLHNIDGGVILWKKNFPTPPMDIVDPIFNWEYSDELHGDKLRTNLDISHLSPEHAAALISRSSRNIGVSSTSVVHSRPFAIMSASSIQVQLHRLPSRNFIWTTGDIYHATEYCGTCKGRADQADP
jgi:hypothetical protein